MKLLVARTFTNKQETLAAETRVMKAYGEAGMGLEEPKEGFPGLGSSRIQPPGVQTLSTLSKGALQSHLKQASPHFVQES